jgi:hypothetical protein
MLDDSIEFEKETSGLAIMTIYWQKTTNPEQYPSLDVFLDKVRSMLWRDHKIVVHCECCLSTDEKCERIVSTLKQYNLIKLGSE